MVSENEWKKEEIKKKKERMEKSENMNETNKK